MEQKFTAYGKQGVVLEHQPGPALFLLLTDDAGMWFMVSDGEEIVDAVLMAEDGDYSPEDLLHFYHDLRQTYLEVAARS